MLRCVPRIINSELRSSLVISFLSVQYHNVSRLQHKPITNKLQSLPHKNFSTSARNCNNSDVLNSIDSPSCGIQGSKISIKPNTSKTLRHLHFQKTIRYEDGLQVQEKFVRANLDYKKIQAKIAQQVAKINSGKYSEEGQVGEEGQEGDAKNDVDGPQSESQPQVSDYEMKLLTKLLTDLKPSSILLTFEFRPVYTGGKREKLHTSADKNMVEMYNYKGAYYWQSSRGGQVTYHGPGQMVGYPIVDLNNFVIGEQNEGAETEKEVPTTKKNSVLKSKRKALPARCYVNALEESIIQTLSNGTIMKGMSGKRPFNIKAYRTANTGVWVSDTEKIASIGVHIRRAVTSHGVAINVSTELEYPNRFVMCGLENATTTNMVEQFRAQKKAADSTNVSVRDVGYSYAREFGKLFGFDKVEHYDVDSEKFLSGLNDASDENGEGQLQAGVYQNGILEVLH